MSDVDEYYGAKYRLPNCKVCGEDYMTYKSYKVHQVQIFCANDQCPAFVKTFWVNRSELEER